MIKNLLQNLHHDNECWTHTKRLLDKDLEIGGGRIIGEACHYIDLMRFLTGSKIKSFNAMKMGTNDFVEVARIKLLFLLPLRTVL